MVAAMLRPACVLLLASAGLLACSSGGASCPNPRSAAFCAPMDQVDAIPFAMDGSTLDARDDFANTRATCSTSGAGAPDQTVTFTAPHTGTFEVTTAGSSFDTVLYVLHGTECDGSELACNDNAPGTRSSALSLELEACETVTLVVDGSQANAMGEFRLEITGHEESCTDGLDEDGDGFTDCDDSECLLADACRTGGGGGGGPGTGDWPNDWAIFELEMLDLINQRRAEGAVCGGREMRPVPPLAMQGNLRDAARLHSEDMGERSYFAHQGLDGSSPGDRAERAGYLNARAVGENIAGGSPTAEDAMEGLMNSPGHCENIMSPAYSQVGVGYSFLSGSPWGHYWTQVFGAGGTGDGGGSVAP